MKQKKFKLFELLLLEVELNGVLDQKTGTQLVKGFLNQKVPLITKYEQTPLSEYLKKEKGIINSLKHDLIKEYGVEENGDIIVKATIDEINENGEHIQVINPNFELLNKSFEDLINQEKEISYIPIKIQTLNNIETEENYVILYNLIENE
jgi:hypothetical protein